MTPVSGGTETIRGWYHALITWALVAAVAAVIVFAAMWALGNIRSTPQTASRGKWGVIVAVVASMLLGGSQVYLQTLYDKWAPGFRPDPASYAINDSPRTDRYEVIDLSANWNAKITEYRRAAGWDEPLLADPDLTAIATNCAKTLIGMEKTSCDPSDPDHAMWKTTYNSAQLSMLEGQPAQDQVPYLLHDASDGAKDLTVRRAAWVAVKDRDVQHASLVAIFAAGPCAGGVCPQVVILPKIPQVNGGVPDQDQVGGR